MHYGGMPNLVVYVPADLARTLEAKGISEDLQRRACKEVLVGLGAGDVPGAAVSGDAATDGEARGGVIPPRPGVRISPSPAPSSPVSAVKFPGRRAYEPPSGKCAADAPSGTRCKLCGEVHK